MQYPKPNFFRDHRHGSAVSMVTTKISPITHHPLPITHLRYDTLTYVKIVKLNNCCISPALSECL